MSKAVLKQKWFYFAKPSSLIPKSFICCVHDDWNYFKHRGGPSGCISQVWSPNITWILYLFGTPISKDLIYLHFVLLIVSYFKTWQINLQIMFQHGVLSPSYHERKPQIRGEPPHLSYTDNKITEGTKSVSFCLISDDTFSLLNTGAICHVHKKK